MLIIELSNIIFQLLHFQISVSQVLDHLLSSYGLVRKLKDHLAMSHTSDILGVSKQNIDRCLSGQHHIGDHRLKGRIALIYNTDASLSGHLLIFSIFILEY